MQMLEPDAPIVTSMTLKETGPAVFAMFVLRVRRAPKGDLSLNDTAIPILPRHIFYEYDVVYRNGIRD